MAAALVPVGGGRRKATGPPPLTHILEVKGRVSSRSSLKTDRHTHALTHRHSQSGRQPPSIRLGPTNRQQTDREQCLREREGVTVLCHQQHTSVDASKWTEM